MFANLCASFESVIVSEKNLGWLFAENFQHIRSNISELKKIFLFLSRNSHISQNIVSDKLREYFNVIINILVIKSFTISTL